MSPPSSSKPRADAPCILVTNDDGFDAPGIAILAEAAGELGNVVVAAPDTEQSASSHSLTLVRPLRVIQVDEDRFRIDGTPTDCVHLAVPRLTGNRLPDLILSGINRGLNVGDDVTYSGTVAGALEGTLLHVPSLAVSAETDERDPKRPFEARIFRSPFPERLPPIAIDCDAVDRPDHRPGLYQEKSIPYLLH